MFYSKIRYLWISISLFSRCGLCENFESDHSAEVRTHSQLEHPEQECNVTQILQERPAKIRKLDEASKDASPPAAVVLPTNASLPAAFDNFPPASIVSPLAASPSVSNVPDFASVPIIPAIKPPAPIDVEPSTSNSSSVSSSPVPPSVSPAPSDTSSKPYTTPANQYICKMCNFSENRLKKVYSHWEEKHKASGSKFAYTLAKSSGKQCRHCRTVVDTEKEMQDHFKSFHPEFVSMTYQVIKL